MRLWVINKEETTMHPNMRRLLGLDAVKPIFHPQTWPTPVDIPADKKGK